MLRHQRPDRANSAWEVPAPEAHPAGSPRRSRRERGELAEVGVATGELPFRAVLEERFGEELSWVKVRREPAWLRELGAKAASEGDTVVLSLRPPTLAEVAHEVAHVLQARHAGARGPERPSTKVDPAEREAETAAAEIAAGRPATVRAAPSAAVQRLEQDDAPEVGDPSEQSPAVAQGGVCEQDTVCEHDPLDPSLQPPTSEAAPPEVGYARGLLRELQEGLVPAWDAAVAGLDADGAEALLAGVLDRLSTLEGLAAYLEDGPWAARVEEEVQEASRELAAALSPQVFGGSNVSGGRELPKPGPGLGTRIGAEGGLVVALLRSATEILGQLQRVDEEGARLAFEAWDAWRGRPCNLRFLDAALGGAALRRLDAVSTVVGGDAAAVRASVEGNAARFGATTDVGSWDEVTCEAALCPQGLDLRVSDEDARGVARAVLEASPDGRLALLRHLREQGRLDRLAENLAPNDVKAMLEGVEDRDLREQLLPHTSPVAEGDVSLMGALADWTVERKLAGDELGAGVIAAGATIFDTACLGVPQALADTRKLAARGDLSADSYRARNVAAVAGPVAMLSCTLGVAEVVAPAAQGVAAGIGLEGGVARGAATVFANVVGSGAGQLAADGIGNLAGTQEGLSSPARYALGAASAGLVGLGTSARVQRLGAAGPAAPRPWEPTNAASKSLAKELPWADNTSARLHNGGARVGHFLRGVGEAVSSGRTRGPDLGPVAPFTPWDALRAPTIEPGQPVSKLLTAEEAAAFYPQAGPGSPTARLQGFAGDGTHPAWRSPTPDTLRQALGVGPAQPPSPGAPDLYARYNGKDLVVAQGRTGVVPDLPLARDWGDGTPIGGTNPGSWHRPGVGRTVGGVPEGVYPKGTPFQVENIAPAGQVPPPGPGPAGPLPVLDHLRHFPTLYSAASGALPGAVAAGELGATTGGLPGTMAPAGGPPGATPAPGGSPMRGAAAGTTPADVLTGLLPYTPASAAGPEWWTRLLANPDAAGECPDAPRLAE